MDISLSPKTKLSGTEWAVARQRAINSLDPICAICHKYIDIQLPMKDPETGKYNPLAVEVDHIIPRVRGGPMYALDNLQLSHMQCNRKKGSKMASDYDHKEYENPFPHSNAW